MTVHLKPAEWTELRDLPEQENPSPASFCPALQEQVKFVPLSISAQEPLHGAPTHKSTSDKTIQ